MVKVKFSPREEQSQSWHDHLYGSGDWTAGDVREVDDWTAVCLLRHDDMFSDGRHHKQRGPIEATPPKPVEEEDESDQAPLMSLDTMTKDQVAVYAKRNFGVDLPAAMRKGEMVDRVRFLMGRK